MSSQENLKEFRQFDSAENQTWEESPKISFHLKKNNRNNRNWSFWDQFCIFEGEIIILKKILYKLIESAL
jgi:hypothetical protein